MSIEMDEEREANNMPEKDGEIKNVESTKNKEKNQQEEKKV